MHRTKRKNHLIAGSPKTEKGEAERCKNHGPFFEKLAKWEAIQNKSEHCGY